MPSGEYRLLGAMALVHRKRKDGRQEYPGVYDILSDGDRFEFYHLGDLHHLTRKGTVVITPKENVGITGWS